MPDLYNACKENDTHVALQFLYELVPPTYIDKNNGFTCLHWSAMHGNVTLTQRLLECGASEAYHRRTRLAKLSALRKLNAKSNATTTTITADAIDNESAGGDGDLNSGGDGDGTVSVEEKMNEDEEEDDDEGLEEDRALEKKFNLLQNTPLLWATMKGHLGVVWCLLVNHYSSCNDTDELGNNMLHIASACGYYKILKIGIEDGGNIYTRNIYHNYPIHLANTKEIHELLSVTRDTTPVPLTEAEVYTKHEANVQKVCVSGVCMWIGVCIGMVYIVCGIYIYIV